MPSTPFIIHQSLHSLIPLSFSPSSSLPTCPPCFPLPLSSICTSFPHSIPSFLHPLTPPLSTTLPPSVLPSIIHPSSIFLFHHPSIQPCLHTSLCHPTGQPSFSFTSLPPSFLSLLSFLPFAMLLPSITPPSFHSSFSLSPSVCSSCQVNSLLGDSAG